MNCLAKEHNAITPGKAQTWNPAQLGHRASKFLNIVTMVTLTFTIPMDRRWRSSLNELNIIDCVIPKSSYHYAQRSVEGPLQQGGLKCDDFFV